MQPYVEQRSSTPYLAIRSHVPMSEFDQVIPQSIAEVHDYIQKKGVTPIFTPFVRYNVINMEGRMDIEVGWPLHTSLAGEGRIQAGNIPAGRYAVLHHHGHYDALIESTKFLLGWAKQQGIVWDNWQAENGDAFGGRFEFYLTDPQAEPDMNKHETEIAIRMVD